MSVNMPYFWGVVMLNVITAVSAGMFVKAGVMEKAEGLYKDAPLLDKTGTRSGAARDLRACLVENKVFVIPFPDLPEDTPEPDPIMVPEIRDTKCEYTDGKGKPAETVVFRYRPRRLTKEIKRFHECICGEKEHKEGRACHFNMLQTGYNMSVLQEVLGNGTQSALGVLTSGRQEFTCHIKRNLTIACHIKRSNVTLTDSKLHRTLVCLSSSLSYHVCGVEHQPTYPDHPADTTVLPAGNTASGRKARLGIILLSLGCLLFLLIGVFITVLTVHCWRKKRKRRQKKSIVKRPQQHARSNSYADNLNHVYDYLPDEQMPDILSQRSSGHPVHSQFGSERSISVSSTLRSVSYSPSVREQGYYEPLTRQDDAPSLPSRPIPKSRFQSEETSHDYLDIIEENKQEEQDGNPAGPTYFVLENASETSPLAPETKKDEYVALLGDGQVDRDDAEDKQMVGPGNGSLEDRESPADDTEKGIHQSSEGEVCVLGVQNDQLDDLSGQLDESIDCPEDDQYEIPVPATPSFDLASSFKGTTEGLDKRRYKDYERILPKLPEGGSNNSGENAYFVLEP